MGIILRVKYVKFVIVKINHKAFALHIGLDSIESLDNTVASAPLKFPKDVAHEMDKHFRGLEQYGFKHSEIITNESATKNRVIHEINNLASNSKRGDFVWITFSGHGGRDKDIHTEEQNGFDEFWRCYDDSIFDDELCQLWAKFEAGVSVFVISDSCFSGTILKGACSQIEVEIDLRTGLYQKLSDEHCKCETGETIQASILCLSAVSENQMARDGQLMRGIMEVWKEQEATYTYQEFLRELRKTRYSTRNSKPHLFELGPCANTCCFSKQPFLYPNQKTQDDD